MFIHMRRPSPTEVCSCTQLMLQILIQAQRPIIIVVARDYSEPLCSTKCNDLCTFRSRGPWNGGTNYGAIGYAH